MSSTEEIPADEADQDVKPAESSAVDEGVENSFLDVVSGALEGSEETPASDESGKETPKPEPANADEDPSKDDESALTDDELGKLSQRAQNRIRGLVQEVKGVETRLQEAMPKIERFDRITGFMEKHGIKEEEFDNTLGVVGLVKSGQYDKALEVLSPIVQELQKRAGEILPDDLMESVRLGEISEARAKELHKARTQSKNLEQRQQRDQDARTREEQERSWNEQVDTVSKAADDWAKGKATSDPDWPLKQDLIAEQVQLELYQTGPKGYPKTAQDAVTLSERALKKVEERLKKLGPKPQARQTVTGFSTSPRAKTQPASHLEAVSAALEGSG